MQNYDFLVLQFNIPYVCMCKFQRFSEWKLKKNESY